MIGRRRDAVLGEEPIFDRHLAFAACLLAAADGLDLDTEHARGIEQVGAGRDVPLAAGRLEDNAMTRRIGGMAHEFAGFFVGWIRRNRRNGTIVRYPGRLDKSRTLESLLLPCYHLRTQKPLGRYKMLDSELLEDTELAGVSARHGLVERVDLYRAAAIRKLDPEARAEMGQFPTPPTVARFMASLFGETDDVIRLLDAGAGVGTLTAAFVENACHRRIQPRRIEATVYELDPLLAEYLHFTLGGCQELCEDHGVAFAGDLRQADFIVEGVAQLRGDLFAPQTTFFNRAILNPPYRKIRSDSIYRTLLREIGVETSNLYAGFLAIVISLLEPGGELVAITPRSFCNGPYFKPFRELLLENMALKRIHVFESRDKAFSEDEVLQENVIFQAVKNGTRDRVAISRTQALDDDTMTIREVPYDQVVRSNDSSQIIHIVTSEIESQVKDRVGMFEHTLEEIGLSVSTGRVVDFRAKDALRSEAGPDVVPLIYPAHFVSGAVRWPNRGGKKPEAIVRLPATQDFMLPSGFYVLVKRFSAKEEPRRVVAAVLDPRLVSSPFLAFENHLNYYHSNNAGLPADLAKGLALFLNSTLIDVYFRQFSGHTQVNATDLRMLRYPCREVLERLGARLGDESPSQRQIDTLLEEEMRRMTDIQSPNPISAKQKMDEALGILRTLGLPRGQLNERSALTLLALLALEPETPWVEASNPRMGITPIMDFCRDHYGTKYAPNTRETFRRQTMHQFVVACLALPNPDLPDRPVNSPKWCYQVEPKALRLFKSFGTTSWPDGLAEWQATVETLKHRYAREREMNKVPLQLVEGKELYLTPGNHSRLIRSIVEEFAPRFAPGGQVIYVGDTGEKWAYFETDALKALGVSVDEHGKMPDVVIYHSSMDWLLLVEAVTSHGPVDAKRRNELAHLFRNSRPGLVYVTAFLNRGDLTKYASEISWATEVWIAEAESHLIHFNGERFLGPYADAN
jgi:adenine-specific DNA-methyltransferase